MKKIYFTVDEFNLINSELELNLETNHTEITNEQMLVIYDYAIENDLLVLGDKILSKLDDDYITPILDIKNDQLIY